MKNIPYLVAIAFGFVIICLTCTAMKNSSNMEDRVYTQAEYEEFVNNK